MLDERARVGTVGFVRHLFSARCGPAGERVLVELADDARTVLTWFDHRPDTDLTGWLADLVLVGWTVTGEPTLPATASEQVQVATLVLEGVVVYLVDADNEAWVLDAETTATWAMLGVDRMIVAGVAHEADDAPGDARGLDAPDPTS